MNELYDPTDSLTHRIAPLYNAELKKFDIEGRWNAPYQFTIPIMAAMWLDLQKGWIVRRAKDWQIQQSNGDKVAEMAGRWAPHSKLTWGNIDPVLKRKGRNKVLHALECPIRAIAFFSWEESGRIFLARRVFPTFFNFLSYSHCPEGWGALGSMVDALKENQNRYFTSCNGGITRIAKFSQSALPFLSEVKRLNYKAIFVIPVVKKWGEFRTTHDLRGAFVLFVGRKSQLPKMNRTAHNLPKRWLEKTNQQVVAILKTQDELFERPALEALWQEKKLLRKFKKLSQERGIFRLTITKGHGIGKSIDLKEVISNLIASLSTSEFHAILDVENTKQRTAVVLIAKSELLPRIERVKLAILRAVAVACEQKPEKFIVHLEKL